MKGKIFFSALCIVAIFQVVIFPAVYMQAFFAGLSLFTAKLLPVLFPFFVFCGVLLKTGVLLSFSEKFLALPAKKLGLSPHFPYVFILACLSGYPMNAKLTRDLFENGEIDSCESESIAFSTSCSGVLFVCSTVGIIMLESALIGVILMICHILACIGGYFIFRHFACKTTRYTCAKKPYTPTKNRQIDSFNILDATTESVASALSSILLVGAYVCVFSVICKMFEVFGLFGILSGCMAGFLQGLFEITLGISTIATQAQSPISISLITALISFGGISINLQSLGLLLPCGISGKRYFLLKTIQMLCGAVIGFGFGAIFYQIL